MNTTQAQQKALDDDLVTPADHLEFGKCNMRLKTNIKPKEATFQVVLDALALTPFYQAFLITVDVPAIYMQEFWATVSVHKDLGHSRDIIYLTDVNVDYLHQPWRAFATVINKCLSGKETGMDKIRLSHAQILWGVFYKKNIDYVYLLWEDFMFHIEYKDAKKTNKMPYPRFTKIIIDYFMSKDQSISRRNKMFWHTARDDTMFTSIRCIFRHNDTQKPVQDTKGTKLKTKAKVAKSDKKKQPAKKPKAKGLAVLSEVALTKAKQLKLATKRSNTQFHSSHASGSGDGVDTQSKIPDEQHLKMTGADEGTNKDKGDENNSDDISDKGEDDNDGNNGNDGDDDDANDDDKQEGDDTNEDDEETDSDRTESGIIKMPILDQSTTEYYKEEEAKFDHEETMNDDEDDEVTKELYEDVNVNLGYEDTEMTNADQGASEQQNADEPVQSSSVSSKFTSKLLNLEKPSLADNEIASLMETSACHATAVPENTSGFTTTIPPPPMFFNPLLQQATPTPTPTTSEATTSFSFTNLEKDLSEIKQVEQQEAQDEKNAYIELVDTSMRDLIKEEVNTQLPQILPQAVSDFANSMIEKNVTESVEAAILTSDKDLFDSYGEVFSLKRSQDEKDKDRDPSIGSDRGTKRRKLSKDAKSSRDSSHTVEDSGMQQDQEFVTRNNDEQPTDKEVTKADWFNKSEQPPTLDPDW
ncbi:hypothetical protein Tco_0494233 [Tanacetum coccineum]